MIVVLRPMLPGTEPALFDHRDVGDAVLFREVVGGRKAVAAADDDDVVGASSVRARARRASSS